MIFVSVLLSGKAWPHTLTHINTVCIPTVCQFYEHTVLQWALTERSLHTGLPRHHHSLRELMLFLLACCVMTQEDITESVRGLHTLWETIREALSDHQGGSELTSSLTYMDHTLCASVSAAGKKEEKTIIMIIYMKWRHLEHIETSKKQKNWQIWC